MCNHQPEPVRCPAQPDLRPETRRRGNRGRGNRGFTFTELLIAFGIISILTSVVVIVVSRVRSSAATVACLSNLRSVGEGFRLYAVDHSGRLPDPVEAGTSWEDLVRKYIDEDRTFRCPSDSEVYPSVGSSYDWRDAGGPEGSMAGRAIADVRGDAVMAFESLPGWHSHQKMNAVMADGSARSMQEDECLGDVMKPVK